MYFTATKKNENISQIGENEEKKGSRNVSKKKERSLVIEILYHEINENKWKIKMRRFTRII